MTDMIKVEYTSASGIAVALDEQTVIDYCTRGNGNITRQEVALFIRTCQAKRLDPLENGEVYLIKYDNTKPAQIVVGKHAYNRRADKNPEYMGKKSGIVVVRDNQVIQKEGCCIYEILGEVMIGGWCRVFRQRPASGAADEIYREVSFSEYSSGQANWKAKPATMIEKVAVSQCLREAFPNDYEGLYSEDEMIASGAIPNDVIDVTDRQQIVADAPISQEKRKALFHMAQSSLGREGGNNLIRSIMEEFGLESTTGMTESIYEDFVERVEECIRETDPTADDPVDDSEGDEDGDFREE